MRTSLESSIFTRSPLLLRGGFDTAFALSSKGSCCSAAVSSYLTRKCVQPTSTSNRLLSTAGGIGPDGAVEISSLSTVAITGIFPCKGVDHGEVIRCRRRRVGARGGTGLYMTAVKQQQLERSQGRPGPRVTGAASETPATSTAITATFDVVERMEACEREGRWREAMDAVEATRRGGVEPTQRVYATLVRLLLRSQQVLVAADVLEQAMPRDVDKRLPIEISLQVMKHLLGSREHSRVIRLYRSLRVRRYIGQGSRAGARATTMATCYGAQASESLLSWRDVEDMYKLYLVDREAASGGEGWGGLGDSLPCVVFRTLYKVKRYEEALPHLENAISAKKFCNTMLCNMAINCLAKTKRWAEAISVFERMSTDLDQPADGMTYSLVINSLALSGRWEEAVALYDGMIASLGPSNLNLRTNPAALTSCLNSAINACDIAGRWQKALELLRCADEDAVPTDMISFSTTMNALVRAGQCEAALEIFREMLDRKLEPGLVACNFVLTYCSKYKQGTVAMAFLDLMKKSRLKVTAVSYNAVITALHREDKPEHVISTFREMELRGLCPDTFAACHCLIACGKLDDNQDAAAGIIRALWRLAGSLDERLYNKAFSVLARGGNVKAISGLLTEMEIRGIEPTEGCYTSLISAYCKTERQDEAEAALFDLKSRGKSIRTAAFTSVISSFKQSKEADRALELFEEMKRGPPEALTAPNQYTYNAIIGVLTFSGRLEQATEKFKEMQEAGFEYDQLTFANMILGFARHSRHSDVLVMFRGLEALTAASAPNGVWETRQKGYWACYNEALKACEAEGEWEMARRLLRSMRHQSMILDVVAYGACIGACARAGRWQEALSTLREMEAMDNVTPNVVCYSSAITACEKGGEWRKALHLLLRMINSGVKPDTIAYNASISASAKCGEWQMALKLFDSLLRAGLSPDAHTYSSAILACFKGHQWQKAMELFGLMLRDDKLPDKYTINLLLELLDSHKQYEKAVYVYETVFRSRQAPESWDPSEGDVVDLHGFAEGVAKAAIRSGLRNLLRRFLTADKDPSVVRDFTFITGQGRHSRKRFEPVLRPAAQDMFLEEFDPPLASHFEPGNTGRLRVCKQDLVEWCRRQSSYKSRGPAPADALGSLKLRDVNYLQREYEKAVRAAAAEADAEAAAAATAGTP